MHTLRVAIAAAAVLAVVAGVGPSTALADSGVQCASSQTYGSQCIAVWGTGLQIKDIQTWYMTPTGNSLDGLKWRVNLERYNCNPIHATKAACPVAQTWDGVTKSGHPAAAGQYCASISFDGAYTLQQCYYQGEDDESAADGYWPSFYALPHTFGSSFWLCTELQKYDAATGKWNYNAAGLTYGLRACVQVSG